MAIDYPRWGADYATGGAAEWWKKPIEGVSNLINNPQRDWAGPPPGSQNIGGKGGYDYKKDQYGNYIDPASGNIITEPDKVRQIMLMESMAPVGQAPVAPDWRSALDEQGNLMSQYQMGGLAEQTQAGQLGFNEFQKRALSTEFSPWVAARQKELDLQAQRQREGLTGQMQGQQATAQSQLAMAGGLTGGARERLARSGALGTALAQQGIAGQRMGQELGIQSEDIGQRQQMLTQLPGMEAARSSQWLAAKGADISGALGEIEAKRLADLKKYGMDMAMYGKSREAQAQALEAGKDEDWGNF